VPRRGARQELTRIGAPLAFLAAVTVLVLLVHSALSGGKKPATTAKTSTTRTTTHQTTTQHTTTRKTTTGKGRTGPPKRYYIVVAGDTFGAIAAKYNSTVDEIVALNPGVDSSALRIGQKIRVR
jgi:LysM repeat protein